MADYERIHDGNSDGLQLCAAGDKISFYGAVPVVIRPYSSAVHATSAASSSTDFGATQLAIVQEIMKTLIGLGVWATV
jgi:hypothetical protein